MFLRCTMQSRQEDLCNFGLFLFTFGCYGNSLGSLENLHSMFEFAELERPYHTRKNVSISGTEIKL